MSKSKNAAGAVLLMVVLSAGLIAQEPVDDAVNWRIRQEATTNSQILDTLHYLTDVYGPRLTGSPSLEAAGQWAIDRMASWGMTNGQLEPWDFGHPGWANERMTAHLVSPVKDPLVAEVLAWTPSTDGVVTAEVFQLVPPERPTEAELTGYLDSIAADVAGKAVLVGEPRFVPVTIDGPVRRRSEAELRAQFNPNLPPAPPARGGGGPRPGGDDDPDRPLSGREVAGRIAIFLAENGAAVQVNDAGRDHGQIRAFSNRTYDLAQAAPTLVMRNEDFGRIARLVPHGPVELEVEIINQSYPDGATSYNATAEIRGTDKADEVIMLGGHLDSWHAATGATDNGIGVTVMMEAARILAAIGVEPRRTIRVALWTGEEQGLLGSQAYVKQHFGSFEDQLPEYSKFGGYFNIDGGTGQARGASVFGPGKAAEVLRSALAPFEDIGVLGAGATMSRRRGGSDHTSFNEAGLPGIGMRQDPIQYGTYTWHTNLDTYERVIEGDAIKSAITIAAAVYHLAMRDELLPRLSEEGEMPALPGTPRP